MSQRTSDIARDEDEEWVLFAREDTPAPHQAASGDASPWLILIVDDDPYVHEATAMALAHVRPGGRPCRFLHAHSAQAARELLRQQRDIDLVLLDVVMETRDAGLRLIRQLREEDQRAELRIVLRSGQPGWERESQLQLLNADGYIPKARQTLELLTQHLDRMLGTPHKAS